jgi:regulator of replication initiation timing
MFDRRLRERIETLEAELARVKAEIAELKTNFGHLTGENAALRAQNDHLIGFGIVPAKRIKRHDWPDYSQPEPVQ